MASVVKSEYGELKKRRILYFQLMFFLDQDRLIAKNWMSSYLTFPQKLGKTSYPTFPILSPITSLTRSLGWPIGCGKELCRLKRRFGNESALLVVKANLGSNPILATKTGSIPVR